MNIRPFFIFYVPRSGSTLLSRLMVEQLGYVIPPESRFLLSILNTNFSRHKPLRAIQYYFQLKKDGKFSDWGCSNYEIIRTALNNDGAPGNALIDAAMKTYSNMKGCGDTVKPVFFGFKKGSYRHHAEKICRAYPETKFLCLIRDGRAVFNSQKKSLYTVTGKPFATDPKVAAREWVQCVELFRSFLQQWPERTRIFRFEDFLAEHDVRLKEIARFISNQLRSNELINPIDGYDIPKRYSDIHVNVPKGIINSRIDAWKEELTEEDINIFESIARGELLEMGYKLIEKDKTLP